MLAPLQRASFDHYLWYIFLVIIYTSHYKLHFFMIWTSVGSFCVLHQQHLSFRLLGSPHGCCTSVLLDSHKVFVCPSRQPVYGPGGPCLIFLTRGCCKLNRPSFNHLVRSSAHPGHLIINCAPTGI